MSLAFLGSAGKKAEMLARLERHAAAGSLTFGTTCWDGKAGTPLGVTIEGTDAKDYSARVGFPLALAAWLDPLTGAFSDDSYATEFARQWLASVEPGADLSLVPLAILSDLLATSGTVEAFPDLVERIISLHEQSRNPSPPSRSKWSEARQFVGELGSACEDRRQKHLLGLCEAACWPLENSQSVLTELGRLWLQLAYSEPDPKWSVEDRQRMEALMQRLGEEHRKEHGPNSEPNYPAMFRAAEPELEGRFVAHLNRQNENYRVRATSLGMIVLAALKAGIRTQHLDLCASAALA